MKVTTWATLSPGVLCVLVSCSAPDETQSSERAQRREAMLVNSDDELDPQTCFSTAVDAWGAGGAADDCNAAAPVAPATPSAPNPGVAYHFTGTQYLASDCETAIHQAIVHANDQFSAWLADPPADVVAYALKGSAFIPARGGAFQVFSEACYRYNNLESLRRSMYRIEIRFWRTPPTCVKGIFVRSKGTWVACEPSKPKLVTRDPAPATDLSK